MEAPPPVGGSWGEDDLDAHTAGDSQGVDDKEADHVAVGRTGRARNPVEEGHSPAEEAAVEVAHTPQAAVLSLPFRFMLKELLSLRLEDLQAFGLRGPRCFLTLFFGCYLPSS